MFTTIGILIRALVVCAALAMWLGSSSVSASAVLPQTVQHVALFDLLVSEIERIDGDGLVNRETRPESWSQTTARLREAARSASTAIEYGQVFHQLRHTYPNSHARIELVEEYRSAWAQRDARLPVTIRAETVTPGVTRPSLRIAHVDDVWVKSQTRSESLPRVGDVVIAMNDRSANDWLGENEIFCKLPTALQCPIEFHRNLTRGLLFWHPEKPLAIDVLRAGETIRFTVASLSTTSSSNASTTSSSNAKHSWCESALNRVPLGFKLVFSGTMVCVFEHDAIRDTQLWRIASFASEKSRTFDAIPGQHKTVDEEVDHFYATFWEAKSPLVKHLIIDVAGNSGGESVVAWLRLLLNAPFQSDFVRFRKIREFDEPNVNRALFWNSKGALYQSVEALKRDGTFAKTREGHWLPAVPAFCPDTKKLCANELHRPREHGFKGKLSVITDPFCNSACVTFANAMKSQANARIVGLPHTADTSISRLQIHFGFDRDGKAITQIEDDSDIAKKIGIFTASATRSETPDGERRSGVPLMPDHAVERRWDQDGDQWARAALTEALKR